MLITVNQGLYRNEEVHNQSFELVQDIKKGAKGHFITVRPNKEIGVGRGDKIRINVEPDNVVYPEGYNPMSAALAQPVKGDDTFTPIAKAVKQETDQEIMDRIADRFEILEEMTAATIESKVRGMIVVGPPGVGKSFGVLKQLEKAAMFSKISGKLEKYEVVKGAATALGLYVKLYNRSEKGQVIVFDDCDSILQDELSLNLLKAALDSGKKRRICWNSDSNLLNAEGIPNSFEFKGSVIFITNINFDNVRSKKLQDHLGALTSRCHYLDLTMNTMRDRMLRIKQIHGTGELFKHYNFKKNEGDQIVAYMEKNKDRLREVSLRAAVKLADLMGVSKKWERLAESTMLKNSF